MVPLEVIEDIVHAIGIVWIEHGEELQIGYFAVPVRVGVGLDYLGEGQLVWEHAVSGCVACTCVCLGVVLVLAFTQM